ncbi:hypothetical protein DFH09DRAFT_1162933 [Mycena vulgaris]|nr:hypothetical protein DFH09DRAFT_1162933 [Mycena vulgaris]
MLEDLNANVSATLMAATAPTTSCPSFCRLSLALLSYTHWWTHLHRASRYAGMCPVSILLFAVLLANLAPALGKGGGKSSGGKSSSSKGSSSGSGSTVTIIHTTNSHTVCYNEKYPSTFRTCSFLDFLSLS